MATQGTSKKSQAKSGVSFGNGVPPPVRLAVADTPQSVAKDIMGWVAMCICIGLLLPLHGFLYVDILTAKKDVEITKKDVQIELTKVQELRRQIEQEKRKEK